MKEEDYKLKFIPNLLELREILQKAHKFVGSQFQFYEDKKSHAFDHIVRVTNTCLELAPKIGAYLDILLISAIFHDVGRPIEEITGKCHAEISAEKASEFLVKNNLESLQQDVIEAILSHRFSKNIQPKSIEAKLLQDADALDALGAIGLYRTISYSCEKQLELKEALVHFDEKLFKLPDRMHFSLTKQIAEEKCSILREFVGKVKNEMKNSYYNVFLEFFDAKE